MSGTKGVRSSLKPIFDQGEQLIGDGETPMGEIIRHQNRDRPPVISEVNRLE
ncbi:MAG: hypothetical protein HC796_01870 [Synechococcaceae cyanobacterium RL_1_2]|nr:hypothetical protein [Synechococcaceae cyanobacterium RL_1_2]